MAFNCSLRCHPPVAPAAAFLSGKRRARAGELFRVATHCLRHARAQRLRCSVSRMQASTAPQRRNIDGELQWLQSNSGAALGARFSAAVLAQLPQPR